MICSTMPPTYVTMPGSLRLYRSSRVESKAFFEGQKTLSVQPAGWLRC